MTEFENGVDAGAPVAKRVPQERVFHGDTFVDDYEWLRDKDSAEVREYVAAQNRYCAMRMEPLKTLRTTLFEEFKSHVQETDMSVPTRMDGYWYFTRTKQGEQYGVQCRLPIRGDDDWDPPHIEAGVPIDGEQIVFDTNVEAKGHDFFRIGGMDISKDGRWLLYGVDTRGDERYDFHIRDLETGEELPEVFEGIAGACFTPDAQWVFYTLLDDAWRPCAIMRHHVGTPVADDVEVFREADERFWVGIGLSFDERNIVIGTGSKTTTEVLLLPTDTPEGEFRAFIPRETDVEYDVSFACFEGAGEHGEDIPLAVVYHNALNPNFEIDVIDMRSHEPPYRLGEGVCVAAGSPYGCERGDDVEPGASARPIGTAYSNPCNPAILQGAHGLGIEGIAIHRHFVALQYRAESLPHVAVMTKIAAAEDFLAGRPWRFTELVPHALEDDWDVDESVDEVNEERAEVWAALDRDRGTDIMDADDTAGPHARNLHGHVDVLQAAQGEGSAVHGISRKAMTSSDGATADDMPGETRRLYSIGVGGNPSYDAPRVRYSFSSYTRPGELHDIDPATGEDRLLKRATVLGGFDPRDYMERRVWITARDGERIPVSLVWRRDVPTCDSAMFITSYGAYEISSDPGFAVSRISMLDRGVLYAVPHIRGGGEMGRAWYEQGHLLNKKHSFEDFVDATQALQRAGLASPARTVANGGSAGGLLMGAVANMAPECYAGIEADVPFVDALTSILDPSLPLTVTEWDEWGDPLHNADVYRYMKGYTPYENAPESADDVRVAVFPKIFITTSMNDTRVLYVEPMKWLARLQHAGVDAVAKIEVEAGHGGTSGRYKQWEEVSYENAWCLSVMGITS
ncbi:S9 family peptidase [Bifidobacterium moukalabense]|uniref:S9 family peptidase n=1 Tax=Bifidobacterium moukalabense TaxID=1333651 RepID=UPI0010F888F6|nr:S9 family peptidase [Bifidobacterium moukalabense]